MKKSTHIILLLLYFLISISPLFGFKAISQVENALLEGDWDSVYLLLRDVTCTSDDIVMDILFAQVCIITDNECLLQKKYPKDYSDEAIRSFERWVSDLRIRYPENSYAIYLSAIVEVMLGQTDNAFILLNRSIELNDNNYVSLDLRGTLCKLQGDHQRAIHDLTAAININPKYSHPYGIRGEIYLNGRQYDEAIQDLTRAIALDNTNPIYFHNRGNAYKEKGEYAPAIVDYGEAVQRDSTLGLAYFSRGYIYKALRLGFLAYYDFRRFLKYIPSTLPEYLPSHINGIRSFVDTVSTLVDEKAKDYFDVKYLLAQADADRAHSKWAHAMAYYIRTMEIDSTRYEPYMWRGFIFDQLGHPKRAIKDLNKAVEMAPYEALVYKTRARSYLFRFAQGKEPQVPEYDSEKAIEDFGRALALRPDDVEAYYFRGLTYDLLYDTASAISDFEYVLENSASADSLWIRKAKQYLQEHK